MEGETIGSSENQLNDNHNGTGIRSRNIKSTTNENYPRTKDGKRKKYVYFGGPTGALIWTIVLPISLYILVGICTPSSCTLYQWPHISTHLSDYFALVPTFYFIGFLVVIFVLTNAKLGPKMYGEPLINGRRLEYNLNGVVIALITIAVIGLLIITRFPFTIVHDNLISFITYSTIVCFATSIFLYKKSFDCPESELSLTGNTGNAIYDFFMGRELNPRIGNWDIKVAFHYFGLAIWCALDISLIATQAQNQGYAHPTLLLSGLGHAILMLDSTVFEENIFTTHLLKHQGVGFFYIYFTTTFKPALCCANMLFILEQGYRIESEAFTIMLLCFIVASYTFYRFTNSDKSLFVRYPDNVEALEFEYIPAKDNRRILVDGWWSFSRHPNYLADLLTVLSWCIITGTEDPFPYIYFIFLLPFTLYHIKMNEDMCREEFGDEAWDRYCQEVKYKLIKYIY